jgi:hypothetical protein
VREAFATLLLIAPVALCESAVARVKQLCSIHCGLLLLTRACSP